MLEALRKELLIAGFAAFPEAAQFKTRVPNKEELIQISRAYPAERLALFIVDQVTQKEIQHIFEQIKNAKTIQQLIVPALKLAARGYAQPVYKILEYNKTLPIAERVTVELANLPDAFLCLVQRSLVLKTKDLTKIPNIGTILLLAAAKNAWKTLTACALLLSNTDVNGYDGLGGTALHFAALKGCPDICQLLLEHGANVNQQTKNGSSPLHCAVEGHDVATIKTLLANGADPNCSDSAGETPMHLAADQSHPIILNLLIAHNGDIFKTTNQGYSAFALAINKSKEHRKILQRVILKPLPAHLAARFIEHRPKITLDAEGISLSRMAFDRRLQQGDPAYLSPSQYYQERHKPILQSCSFDEVQHYMPDEALILLPVENIKLKGLAIYRIKLKVIIHFLTLYPDCYQAALIFFANKILRELPLQAMNRDAAENQGFVLQPNDRKAFLATLVKAKMLGDLLYPAVVIALHGYPEVLLEWVDFCLAYNKICLPNEKISISDNLIRRVSENLAQNIKNRCAFGASFANALLFYAAEKGCKSFAALAILMDGCQINALDWDGLSALHKAAVHGHHAFLIFLIDRGALIDAKANKGHTALHMAVFNQHAAAVQVLLDKGASPNSHNCVGATPLHTAVSLPNLAIAKQLISRGANVYGCTPLGITPLHSAVLGNSIDAVKLILSHGGHPNAPDCYGVTPVHLAAQEDMPLVLAVLLVHGGDATLITKAGKTACDFIQERDAAFKKSLFKEILKSNSPLISLFISVADFEILKEIINENLDVNYLQLLDLLKWGFASEDGNLIKFYEDIIDDCIRGQDTEKPRFLIGSGLPVTQKHRLPLTRLAFAKNDRDLLFIINQSGYVNTMNDATVSQQASCDRRDMASYTVDYRWRFFTRMASRQTPLDLNEYAAAKLFRHTRDLEGDSFWPEQALYQQAYTLKRN